MTMKKRTEKNKMRYALLAMAAFVLFILAVVLLENDLVGISMSALLATAGTVGLFCAGMKLDFFIFDEGSLLAVIEQWVNDKSEVLKDDEKKIISRPIYTAEIITYQQRCKQQRCFEEIAYIIKAVS